MTNYILLLAIVIILALVLPIVARLWRKRQGFLSLVLLAITMILCSGATWYILNQQAETRPPATDSTAAASSQHIQDQQVQSQAMAPPLATHSYSEKNIEQNRKAVEQFNSVPEVH